MAQGYRRLWQGTACGLEIYQVELNLHLTIASVFTVVSIKAYSYRV
jgi:hypothetical protein